MSSTEAHRLGSDMEPSVWRCLMKLYCLFLREMTEEVQMEALLEQVLQKDLGVRVKVGPEVTEVILSEQRSPDLEQDQSLVDRVVDAVASSWVNSSNFKVVLLGMDILSALVSRLQERFRTQVGTVLPSLMDRLGDAKDQVREQDQALLLKIMDQAANPQFVWERMMGGFKHKNNRTREGLCLCLISTLNVFGSQSLTLSKIVPHICNLLGDPTSQVRDGAMNCLIEIYRHVGERVRMDLGKKGLPQSRLNVIFSRFDEVQRSGNMVLSPLSETAVSCASRNVRLHIVRMLLLGSLKPSLFSHVTQPALPPPDKAFEDDDSGDGGRSSSSSRGGKKTLSMGSFRRTGSSSKSAGRDGSAAGAVDDEDFIQAFEDVPTVQIHSNREVEENMTKIRDVLSDDKKDWELRVAALKKVRSLLLAGASDFDAFPQQLRLMEAAFKLSAKDLRSQVVREACLTMGHLSLVLGSRFDHAAEAIMPILITLVSNSAKIMASSGTAAIRLILKHTHYPRLIPVITSNCTCKSVAVRRRCFEFLEQLLQEWQSSSLERHGTVLMETIKKGIHDADAEARSVARKCYWSYQAHFRREADQLFQSLEASYQKALQAHQRGGENSGTSLPASDRSSSSSQESLSRPPPVKNTFGSGSTRTKASHGRPPVPAPPPALQRSRSDVDVNAASSSARRMPAVPSAFSSASTLPPGSYASLGESHHEKTTFPLCCKQYDYKHYDYKHYDYKQYDYKHYDYKQYDYRHYDYKHYDYKHYDYKQYDYKQYDYKHYDYKQYDYKQQYDYKHYDYKQYDYRHYDYKHYDYKHYDYKQYDYRHYDYKHYDYKQYDYRHYDYKHYDYKHYDY
ncbi:CLIP-associating protein 1-B [Dissostichus eleginoides]|nr:CLIP-associating protein 1-B [Dissostichus eleginoides]